MERIERDVRRELGRFGPVEGAIVEIVRAWPAAVGDTVARSAWPARLARDGTLHVNAVSSTWAFELGRLAETILEQLRRELGDATPPALKFAPGPVPEPEAGTTEETPSTTPEIAAERRA
jgi:Dna[CI] antecedent, DciA